MAQIAPENHQSGQATAQFSGAGHLDVVFAEKYRAHGQMVPGPVTVNDLLHQ